MATNKAITPSIEIHFWPFTVITRPASAVWQLIVSSAYFVEGGEELVACLQTNAFKTDGVNALVVLDTLAFING